MVNSVPNSAERPHQFIHLSIYHGGQRISREKQKKFRKDRDREDRRQRTQTVRRKPLCPVFSQHPIPHFELPVPAECHRVSVSPAMFRIAVYSSSAERRCSLRNYRPLGLNGLGQLIMLVVSLLNNSASNITNNKTMLCFIFVPIYYAAHRL